MAVSPDDPSGSDAFDTSVILSSTLNPTKGFHTTSTTCFALRGSRAHPYELAHPFRRGDLEAPVFAPAAGGPSTLLLDVNIPEVPLHARYGVPKKVMLPPPVAFWACPQEEKASGSGAKRMQAPEVLQFALKDETSTVVLIPHVGSVRAQTLRVPVGDAGDVAFVETGTVVVILFAFVYLLRTIVRASRAQRVAEITAAKKER
ncbi:hypothetical protein BGY98DRAFT_992095 [Russula aff. rugulosa BPL654]|nr:hypothetical protein BGY98DRAFT_992095 [Russula aff. rugulosa BPL654]